MVCTIPTWARWCFPALRTEGNVACNSHALNGLNTCPQVLSPSCSPTSHWSLPQQVLSCDWLTPRGCYVAFTTSGHPERTLARAVRPESAPSQVRLCCCLSPTWCFLAIKLLTCGGFPAPAPTPPRASGPESTHFFVELSQRCPTPWSHASPIVTCCD